MRRTHLNSFISRQNINCVDSKYVQTCYIACNGELLEVCISRIPDSNEERQLTFLLRNHQSVYQVSMKGTTVRSCDCPHINCKPSGLALVQDR